MGAILAVWKETHTDEDVYHHGKLGGFKIDKFRLLNRAALKVCKKSCPPDRKLPQPHDFRSHRSEIVWDRRPTDDMQSDDSDWGN